MYLIKKVAGSTLILEPANFPFLPRLSDAVGSPYAEGPAQQRARNLKECE